MVEDPAGRDEAAARRRSATCRTDTSPATINWA